MNVLCCNRVLGHTTLSGNRNAVWVFILIRERLLHFGQIGIMCHLPEEGNVTDHFLS